MCDKYGRSGFPSNTVILILIFPLLICPENVVCFLCLLHIFKCTSDKILSWNQTIMFAVLATLEHKQTRRQKSRLTNKQVNSQFLFHINNVTIRTFDIRVRTKKFNFLISQPKHMLWLLKRTVSGRSVHLTTLFPGQA